MRGNVNVASKVQQHEIFSEIQTVREIFEKCLDAVNASFQNMYPFHL